jgi:hypothetical protein
MKLNDDSKKTLKHELTISLIKDYAKKGDVLKWGKLLFPDKFPLPFSDELHGYLTDIRNEPYTNTEAPRNHSKTTIKCFLVPIFQALCEPEAYQHYLNVQATSTKAVAVNLAIRSEIENNQLLRDIYGDLVDTKNKWTEKQFVLSNGVIFTAIGAGESLRGINHNNVRPDYLLVDDLYDEDDINNPESTKKKTSWFWGSLYLARAKSKRCCIHVQGTAINKADLLFELQSKSRWKSKTFRAIKDFDTKEVIWPELNSFDDLMADKEDMPSTIFFRELQNERRDEESSIIKESWLKFYDGPALPEVEVVKARRLGVDPSIGEKEQNDYTGLASVIRSRKDGENADHYYVVRVDQKHLTMDARIKTVESWHESENATEARIEAIAGFKDFVGQVKNKTNVPVKEIDHVKDKITNLENKSHYFENGKVFINKNMDQKMKALLIEQLTNNYPAHDDIRDAVLICIDDKSVNWAKAAENLAKAMA